jgi:glycosyltransferase involved in cell wall biosynthesis
MRHRVFIGLTEVAGYLGGLRQGFEDLGVPTLYFDGSAHSFGYARPDILGRAGRVVDRLRARRGAERRVVRRTFWRVAASLARAARAVLKLGLLSRALLTCDAFIFASGETFFRRLDPLLMRALGKRVIVVFLGSDHRPPYLNGRWVRTMQEHELPALVDEIRMVADCVRMAERYADTIVASSASVQFHKRPFVQFIAVGIPGGVPPTKVDGTSRRLFAGAGVRVLHAPSDPISKGTDLIRAAVTAVRSLGYAIDYVELVRRPHADVLAALGECDLVVDEVYSDTPMAVFSAEAAFFGKPALVTGYYADAAGSELRADFIPPSLFCLPHELQDGLLRLVVDEGYRGDLGRRAGAYVLTRWDPAQVAQRYLRIIERDIPADWMVDPLACRYLHGWGMPDGLRRQGLRAIVNEAGAEALCLTHRPDLERLLVEAAT